MKTLLLARHGKAEKSEYGIYDFKRKLVERGKNDVLKVAQELSTILSPEQIISSPAERAIQTAKIFAKTFSIDKKEIIEIESIYEANMSTLLKVINDINNKFKVVLLIGHNPAFEFAIEYLSNVSIGHLPTSGLAIIDFDIDDWGMVSTGLGSLRKVIVV